MTTSQRRTALAAGDGYAAISAFGNRPARFRNRQRFSNKAGAATEMKEAVVASQWLCSRSGVTSHRSLPLT